MTSPGHLATHRPKPCHGRIFLRATLLHQFNCVKNSTCFATPVPAAVHPANKLTLSANTLIQELQIPSIITFQTSHTACLHCTCWRQQQEFIGAVKLADKKPSHPPYVQFGCILSVVSSHDVVIARGRTTRRSPGSLHLEIVYNPCTVSYHPTHQYMIRSNSSLVYR